MQSSLKRALDLIDHKKVNQMPSAKKDRNWEWDNLNRVLSGMSCTTFHCPVPSFNAFENLHPSCELIKALPFLSFLKLKPQTFIIAGTFTAATLIYSLKKTATKNNYPMYNMLWVQFYYFFSSYPAMLSWFECLSSETGQRRIRPEPRPSLSWRSFPTSAAAAWRWWWWMTFFTFYVYLSLDMCNFFDAKN